MNVKWKKKKIQKRGNVLIIVLVLFSFMLQSMLFFTNKAILSRQTNRFIERMDVFRCVEVLSIGYFKQQIRDGVLLYDDILIDGLYMYYTVDDMHTTYDVHVEMKYLTYEYTYTVKIYKKDCTVKEFKYT